MNPGFLALQMSRFVSADAAPRTLIRLNSATTMNPGRGDSMMIDRRRTTAVFAAFGVLGVAACGASYQLHSGSWG